MVANLLAKPRRTPGLTAWRPLGLMGTWETHACRRAPQMELTCVAVTNHGYGDAHADGIRFKECCQEVAVYVSIIGEEELGFQLGTDGISVTYSRRRRSYLVNLPASPAQAIIERGDFSFTAADGSFTIQFSPGALAENV